MDKIFALLPIRQLLTKVIARYVRRGAVRLVDKGLLEAAAVDTLVEKVSEFLVAELYEALQDEA